jgi:hypothetical protein
MQRQHLTAAPQAPVPLDPEAHITHHIARRVADLVGRVEIHSIDGQDARQWQVYREVGVRLPAPTLVRGAVNGHHMELSTDEQGRTMGRCDCTAAQHGLMCCHIVSLAVHAVTLGWEAA